MNPSLDEMGRGGWVFGGEIKNIKHTGLNNWKGCHVIWLCLHTALR